MQEIKKFVLFPLVLIGALNWGLIGLFHYDLIGAIFQQSEVILRIVDSLIGISAVVIIIMMFMGNGKKK